MGGGTRGVDIKFTGGKLVVGLEITMLVLFLRALGNPCRCVALDGLLD
jgi:hypothetical protein